MKITLNTLDEFIAELKHAAAHRRRVLAGCARFRIDETWLQKEKVSREIGVVATAVVEDDAGENAVAYSLVEYSEVLGVEYVGKDLCPYNTVKAQEMEMRLRHELEAVGIELRPGKLEL